MKRKLLLFALLMALFAPWAAAQTTVEIGTDGGTTTNSYLPAYTLYNNTLSEQIYTASEIGMAGTITSISFYNGGTTKSPEIAIYMVNTNQSEFSSNTDWLTVTANDLVFENATVTFTAGEWTTFELTTPFSYDGTSNLGVIVDEHMQWSSGLACRVFESTENCSLYHYDDYVDFNATNPTSGTYNNRLSVKNQLKLEITPAGGPTCARPDEVTAADVTSNSASIRWEGGSGTYNVEYKMVSETEWTRAYSNLSDNSCELSPAAGFTLQPGKAYQARVQSVCVFQDTTLYSGWRNTTENFNTECAAITSFPWSEDFEAYASGDFTDPCWINERIQDGEGYGTLSVFKVYTSTTSGNTTHQLQLPDMPGGTLTKLVLPEMNLPGDDYEFALQVYRSTSTYNDNYPSEGIRVFASTDGNIEGATELAFIPRHYQVSNAVIPAEASEGWYEYELPIGFSGTCYIILRGESQYCTATYMDNFSVKQIPSCQKPKNLTLVANSVTAHTVTLKWAPAVAGQTAQFSLTKNGLEEILEPMTPTNDSTFTLTGLVPETQYTAKVRAYCGEGEGNQSEWCIKTVTFTTQVACFAPTGLTVSDITNRGATLKWTCDTTQTAWIVAFKATSAADEAYVEVPVTENPTYTFDTLTPERGYTVKVRANCGDDDGLSAWTTTQTFTVLVAYPAPSNVKCDSVLADKAYLSWTERGTAIDWEVIYKKVNDIEYDTLLTPDNHPCILGDEGMDPLTPDTVYVFKVRAVYMDLDTVSPWSSEVRFTTLPTCPAPTDVVVYDSTITANAATLTWESSIYSNTWNVKYRTPAYANAVLTEGFEDNESNIPTGWTHIGNGSLVMNTTASRVHTGTYSLRFSGATSNNVVVVPQLGVEANTMEVNFWSLAENSSSSGTFQVGYVTDTADVATFQVIASYNASAHLSYTQVNVSLASAPDGARVAFRHTSASTSYWWWIDDVVIGTPGEWQTAPLAEEVPYELTGLNPLTDYEVVVEGNCGEEISEESASVFFTTLPSCLAPTNLAVYTDSITAHTATLHWTEKGTANEWVIEYTAYLTDTVEILTNNVTDTICKLTGLRAETPYTVRVRSNCSENDQSDWSNTALFSTTVACPAPTDLVVVDTTITTTEATLTWEGTNSNYILEMGTPSQSEFVLFEGFEDPETFANWQAFGVVTTNTGSRFGRQSAAKRTDNYGFAFSSYSSASDYNQYLISPELNRPTKVEFYYKQYVYSNGEVFKVGYSTTTNDLSAFTWGDETTATTSWQLYEQTLSQNVKYVAIHYYSNYDYELYIDDISIHEIIDVYDNWTPVVDQASSPYTFDTLTPGTTYAFRVIGDCQEQQDGVSLPSNAITFTTVATCEAPEGLALANVNDSLTPHTATLSWTETGTATEWWVYYAYANGNELVEDTVVANTNPYMLEGLLAETGYTAKVLAYCNEEDQSNWSNELTFITPIACHTPTDVAFNGYDTLTWVGGSDNNSYTVMVAEADVLFNANFETGSLDELGTYTNDTVYPWVITNASANGGTYSMKSSNEGAASSTSTIQITVELQESSTLSFAARCSSEQTSLTSDWDYGTFYIDGEQQGNKFVNSTTFESRSYSLEAGTYTFTWRYKKDGSVNNNEDCFYVDDIKILTNTITNWTSYPADTNEYVFDGLTPESVYWVKVVGLCDNDEESIGDNTILITTPEACPAPTNLAVGDDIDTNSATLMWEGRSDSYVVHYTPWVQVGKDKKAGPVLAPYTYDLSEFAGTGSIVIRHYKVTDLYYLNVDDIVVTNAVGDTVYSQDFESSSSWPAEISTWDKDGDGYVWGIRGNGLDSHNNPTGNGNYSATSASWSGSALHPDNWMIISGVELGGQLTFVARGQDPDWPEEKFAVYVLADEGAFEETVEGDTQISIWDFEPNTTYSWQVAGVCGTDTTNWVTYDPYFTTLDDALVFVTDGDWDNEANWEPNTVPTTDNNVLIRANAIIPAGVVAEADEITIEEGLGSITIKDGGQLKQGSSVKVTMEKGITGYGEGNGNYYLLAVPFNGRTIYDGSQQDMSHVDSLMYGDYDLYTFDPAYGENQEWVNYEAVPSHSNYVSDNGDWLGLTDKVGYLYANENDITLVFTGNTDMSYNTSTDPEPFIPNDANKGWALVGNVFACNAYVSFVDSIGNPLEVNYYVMNAAGDDFELAETTDGIAPLSAAFVYFGTKGYYWLNSDLAMPASDSTDAKCNRTQKFSVNLSQGGNDVDKILVRKGRGKHLPKMSLNNNSKLYVPMKDKEYAVVYSANKGSMPVSFKAETAGSYTISCNTEDVIFSELILIDNTEGTKVDLLANPSYTFETEAGEFAGRFTIVYKVK